MNISRQLADHVVRTHYETLPDNVIAVSKRAMLDTLAVAWAGSTAPGIPELHALVTSEGGKPESTVWAYGERVPAAAAAFLNSALAGALDYDSVHQEGSVHADIVVLPVSLALAQRQHLTGREFIAAFAIGTDLTCRLGRSALRNSGWFFTSLYGALGATAAAAQNTTQGAANSQQAASELARMAAELQQLVSRSGSTNKN